MKKLRRFIASIGIIGILSTLVFNPLLANSQTFADVPSSHFSYPYVESLVKMGVLSTYHPRFRLNDNITRGEALKIVLEANGHQVMDVHAKLAPFSDLEGFWGIKYVGYAYSTGMIKGYADNTFLPEASITRSEFAKMAVLAAGYKRGYESEPCTSVFSDAQGHWSCGYLNAGYYSKWWEGYSNKIFNISELIVRADAAKIAYTTATVPLKPEPENDPYTTGKISAISENEILVGASEEDGFMVGGIWITVKEETKIFDANGNILEFEYFEEGMKTEVWITGIVLESDPARATASKIVVWDCIPEGEGLGALYLGNKSYCCEGLIPWIEDENLVGTMGICVDKNNIPLTKQEAYSIIENSTCFYDLDDNEVSFKLINDEWTMRKTQCIGLCSVNKYSGDFYVDFNPMCMGVDL